MDTVDLDLREAERDASPDAFPDVPIYTPITERLTLTEPITLGASSASTPSNERDVEDDPDLDPVEANRIAFQRLQHSTTVGDQTRGIYSHESLLGFGARKPFPPPLPNREEYVVEFLGPDDPLHPHNWNSRKKISLSVLLAYNTLIASFASAVFSPGIGSISHQFHVSREVGTLGITLYVLGFAFGPIIWAPLSEISGRRLPIILGMFGFSIFSTGVAVAKDYQTIMLCRFFAGFFSSSPLAVVPACFADLYDNRQRGTAITIFAMAVFMGPFAAPFIGGFITMSYLGWRWTMYISAIAGYFGLVLSVFFLKETYAPVILVEKAGFLRRKTKNWGIHAKQEEIEVDFHELVANNFSRPIRLLISEPIILLVTIYMSFIYGLIYVFLSAYPLVFEGVHGFNQGVGGLPFIGLLVGEMFAGAYVIYGERAYNKKLDANNGVPIPEWRLPPVILGAFCFAGGLFWFGWTGFKESIHWMAPTASGIVTGFGILAIFLQCFNYIIDSYLVFAASAIAANTLLRSIAGAGFPLFAIQMFDNLGIQWAGTLLGCLASAMIPIPVIFYIYGAKIRKRSIFAPTSGASTAVSRSVSAAASRNGNASRSRSRKERAGVDDIESKRMEGELEGGKETV